MQHLAILDDRAGELQRRTVIYVALGVLIAAGVLYLISAHLLLNPMIAAAMSFSSVSVVANALRLRVSKLT